MTVYKSHNLLFDKLLSGSHEANKNYDFNITHVKEISILKYDTGDFYSKHIDMSEHDSDRKLSVIIPLSDDYEGGETLFFTSKNPIKMPKRYLYPYVHGWRSKYGDILIQIPFSYQVKLAKQNSNLIHAFIRAYELTRNEKYKQFIDAWFDQFEQHMYTKYFHHLEP